MSDESMASKGMSSSSTSSASSSSRGADGPGGVGRGASGGASSGTKTTGGTSGSAAGGKSTGGAQTSADGKGDKESPQTSAPGKSDKAGTSTVSKTTNNGIKSASGQAAVDKAKASATQYGGAQQSMAAAAAAPKAKAASAKVSDPSRGGISQSGPNRGLSSGPTSTAGKTDKQTPQTTAAGREDRQTPQTTAEGRTDKQGIKAPSGAPGMTAGNPTSGSGMSYGSPMKAPDAPAPTSTVGKVDRQPTASVARSAADSLADVFGVAPAPTTPMRAPGLNVFHTPPAQQGIQARQTIQGALNNDAPAYPGADGITGADIGGVFHAPARASTEINVGMPPDISPSQQGNVSVSPSQQGSARPFGGIGSEGLPPGYASAHGLSGVASPIASPTGPVAPSQQGEWGPDENPSQANGQPQSLGELMNRYHYEKDQAKQGLRSLPGNMLNAIIHGDVRAYTGQQNDKRSDQPIMGHGASMGGQDNSSALLAMLLAAMQQKQSGVDTSQADLVSKSFI